MTGDDETSAELLASRARIQASADESRRRLQREIHDGTQQRLVHALIALKMARGNLDVDSPAAALVAEALTNLELASRDLREVVHAILPRSLTYGGLTTALRSLAAGLDVRVELSASTPRLRPEDETTAYVVVAETVHARMADARPRRVGVDLELVGDHLVIEVRDDGAWPPTPGLPAGLTAVRDRVRAAGGSLTVAGGCAVRVVLPVETVPDAEACAAGVETRSG